MSILTLISGDSGVFHDDIDKAECLNIHFSSVSTQLIAPGDGDHHLNQIRTHNMEGIYISTHGIQVFLEILDNSQGCGSDGPTNAFLKLCAPTLAEL